MAGKWVDEGENRVANILFGSTAVDGSLYLRLYTDNTEPAETDGLADVTEETGTGYAAITLTRGTWSITADVVQYAEQTFTASAADWVSVYGYYIATSTDNSGKLLAVENFTDGPYAVGDGNSIKIVPKITVA